MSEYCFRDTNNTEYVVNFEDNWYLLTVKENGVRTGGSFSSKVKEDVIGVLNWMSKNAAEYFYKNLE